MNLSYKFFRARLLIVIMIPITFGSKVFAFVNEKSAQMLVSTTVFPFCTIEANPIAFPGYTLQPIIAKTSIIVKCTNGTKYSVGLDLGRSGNNNTRRMQSNANFINYQLYQDDKMSKVWGNNQNNSLIKTGTGQTQIHKVYAMIPANQITAAGLYNDSVLVNIDILNLGADINLCACQMMVRMNISATKL